MEFLVPWRSSCVSCGGGGAVDRRVHGGTGCSARRSKARRAELGFCGSCGGEGGAQGGHGGIYKEAGSNLGRRAEEGAGERHGEISGGLLRERVAGKTELTSGPGWSVGETAARVTG